MSKSNKIIFLRIPKNGSTSVASWFVKNMGKPEDIWTRVNDAGIRDQNVPQEYINKHRTQYHFIHTTLQEICDGGLEEAPWETYNIGIIRNPLERQLSLFFFLNKNGTPEQFREEFRNGCHIYDASNRIKQVDYTKFNGVQYGNFWSYDRIPEHLNRICEVYGIEESYPLPKYKSDRKPKRDDLLSVYYDNYTTAAVLEYYQDDWVMFKELQYTSAVKDGVYFSTLLNQEERNESQHTNSTK